MEFARIIITGASSGLGKAYAETLAQDGRELVLIARRAERLHELADQLRRQHPAVQVSVCPCDLADPAARAQLLAHLASLPAAPCLLINNAGLGDYGELATAEPAKLNALMQVNMLALVEMTHAMLPSMQVSGGAIINLASLAADLFIPDFALYAASKSFVASLSEALRIELKASGVHVLAVCPGPVHTEFGAVAQRAGRDRGDIPLKPLLYTPVNKVVLGSLKALAARRARYYPSLKIWVAGCLLRMLPLWMMRLILNMRPRKTKIQGGAA